jgi:hypothetical protein
MGEYIVEIEYNLETKGIEVFVLDELEGLIESISISDAEDDSNEESDDDGIDIDINLN